MIIFPV